MKYCEDLMLYASGELDGPRKEAFRQHLQVCASCRAELKLLQRTDEALAAAAAPGSVVEELFAKTTRRKSFFAGWKPALAGTALLGLGLLMFLGGLQPDKTAFDASEVIAYMSENLDDEYLSFSNDLALFEQEF